MNKLEMAIGRVIEMAVLYNIHHDTSLGRSAGKPRKMDVIFIPVFHKGETKWTADLLEDGELSDFREAAFCDGMEDTYPEDPSTAIAWLKEFFDLDFNDTFITPTPYLRSPVPDGYTLAEVNRLVSPLEMH